MRTGGEGPHALGRETPRQLAGPMKYPTTHAVIPTATSQSARSTLDMAISPGTPAVGRWLHVTLAIPKATRYQSSIQAPNFQRARPRSPHRAAPAKHRRPAAYPPRASAPQITAVVGRSDVARAASSRRDRGDREGDASDGQPGGVKLSRPRPGRPRGHDTFSRMAATRSS